MKLTNDAVVVAMSVTGGATESAMQVLRGNGYKFANAVFRDMARNYSGTTAEPDTIGGQIEAPDKRRPRASGSTFVFTCAQNNTRLHEKFWDSLQQYVSFRKAELHVSRFVYNKFALAARDAKADTDKGSDTDDTWYDPRILPYVSDQSIQITDDLMWCGDLNIIPTRVHPLSTLKTFTRGNSGIVPHVKMRMDSVPTMKKDDPVYLYTTGTITQRNYIQRMAGQVAEFHHVFGALVVEVDTDGTWYARQLNADANGHFYDVDTLWTPEGPTDGIRMSAITHGDIHGMKADLAIIEDVFEEGGILDMLMPHEQFFHDTIDFMPRNHHNIKDPHFLWSMHFDKTESVQEEFVVAARIIREASRPWCLSVVIVSNHDVAINTWLKNTAAFYDPVNVQFWLSMNQHVLRVAKNERKTSPFIYALNAELVKQGVFAQFVDEDESYKIEGTNIEAGLHGHLGPNGARGSPKNLLTVGKANTAHTHSAGIIDGVYTAGVYGNLDMGYNKGLSSWSHSFIGTYPNGKRAIFTIKNGKAWRDALRRKK
jgi:hypothetical protein